MLTKSRHSWDRNLNVRLPWRETLSIEWCRRKRAGNHYRHPEAGRPADPGQEVDRGAALEAEGAGDRRLAGAAVSGAASNQPRKTVTDSARSRPIRCRSKGHLSSWFVRLCVESRRFVTSGHRGLKRFIEDDDDRGIRRDLVNRVRRVLTALLSVENIEGLEGPPGWRIHQLTGDRAGTWSISVSGNWRITFEIDNNEIHSLDLEDYH